MSCKGLLAAISLSFCMASCANVNTVPPVEVLGRKHVADKNYVIGQPAESVVGSNIILVRDFLVTALAARGVEITSDFALDHFGFSHKFKKGEIYPYYGTVEYQGKNYNVMRVEGGGVLFDKDGAIFKKVINGIGDPRLSSPVFEIYEFDVQPGPHVRLLQGIAEKGHAGGIYYQIVFGGITSDAMHFTYREYETSDLLKPALSQELTYPLKSREIHFRNLVIAVNSVTAEHINYTVVSDGSPKSEQSKQGI